MIGSGTTSFPGWNGNWPILAEDDVSKVRGFLASIQITRDWVKNLANIARPLTRLTGNVEWRWGPSEQLSFQLLREECAAQVEKHGYDPSQACCMYSDASQYAAGGCFTQHRILGGIKKEVVLLYDSFTFNQTQRKYSTYKRELLAIVTFARKHTPTTFEVGSKPQYSPITSR
ncbi:hypothetical protein K3495_g7403 [Podosphaera aphanis]|nr:hypothetical protein K3495_g7403 [Podosphaera aphanis]